MKNVLPFTPPTTFPSDQDAMPARRVVLRPVDQTERWLESAPPTISQGSDERDASRHAVQSGFTLALITTFAPEPYAVTKPLPISIYWSDDGFTASFFDANIYSTGDNEHEAFDNIKSLILDMFEGLISRPIDDLGPGPKLQLSVLEQFIARPG